MPRTATAIASTAGAPDKPLVTLLVRALRPLILLVLKRGMTAYEFTEIARWVFAEVALDRRHFGVPGRDVWSTTKSRAAVLTGLTRREIDRLARLRVPALDATRRTYHRGVRILAAWQESPGFQDADGRPRDLPVKGTEGSLEQLVKAYCRDITVRAMLDELEERGCVRRLDGNMVRFVQAEYQDAATTGGVDMDELAHHAERFLAAIESCLDPTCQPQPGFTAFTIGPIAKEHRKALNDRLRNAAQTFMNQLKREMSSLHQPLLTGHMSRANVGIYHSFSD